MAQELAATESPHSYKVDFSWSKIQYLIQDTRSEKSLIIAKHHCLKPHLEFIEADTNSTIATASIHTFSIHADCAIGAQSIKLKAQKRWATKYSYLSHAYSDNEDPVVMTWTSSTSLSKWDLVLLDESQQAVARYSVNIWGLKKIGIIEFVGRKAESKAAREEVLVTVITLYYCVTVRAMSVFSPFASMFADVKPLQGPDEGTKDVSKDVK